MCYTLVLSTTSSDDLSRFNEEGITFNKNIPDLPPIQHLRYTNKWAVGSRTGCSCSFRHLYGPEFDFHIPEDWLPEEKSDIEATLTFIRLVRLLLEKGEKVDCIDLWISDGAQVPPAMPVDLNRIRDEEFRFFENRHFDFLAE